MRSDTNIESTESSLIGDEVKMVMSHFATGITIVTAIGDSSPIGFTCQSFTSLSLNPPLIALAPAKSSISWPKIARSGTFCVNILAMGQQDVCRAFAVSGGDKFERVAWRPASRGAPVIDGALAWVECALELVHDAGDHELVVGRVLALGHGDGYPFCTTVAISLRLSCP